MKLASSAIGLLAGEDTQASACSLARARLGAQLMRGRHSAVHTAAQAIARAMSLGLAPSLRRDRTSRSTETVGSAASIFATLD